jgi:ABC-type branched-subunit amino acid transport system ATPase component
VNARYVIEERVSPAGAWEPASLPVSPWHDDLRDAVGVLRALQSRRFRVRDTRPDLAVAEGLERTRKRRARARRQGERQALFALHPKLKKRTERRARAKAVSSCP